MKDRVQALWLLLRREADRLNESERSGCTVLHVVGSKRFARNLIECSIRFSGEIRFDGDRELDLYSQYSWSNTCQEIQEESRPTFQRFTTGRQKKEIAIYLERASWASSTKPGPEPELQDALLQTPLLKFASPFFDIRLGWLCCIFVKKGRRHRARLLERNSQTALNPEGA